VPEDYERPASGIQTIGAAFAPTPEGREALRFAAELARAESARLRAITVLDPKHAEEQSPGLLSRQHHDTDPAEAPAARHRLAEEAELRETLDSLGQDVESEVDILFNDAVEGLLAAGRHVDLLVMGSRGRGPLRAAILGSVSHSVARRAPCPVLILPRG
jgi:nucleotide-binding universal stress UspA family protein